MFTDPEVSFDIAVMYQIDTCSNVDMYLVVDKMQEVLNIMLQLLRCEVFHPKMNCKLGKVSGVSSASMHIIFHCMQHGCLDYSELFCCFFFIFHS